MVVEEQFTIEVESLSRREYIQAGSEQIRRLILPVLGIGVVLILIIAMLIGDFSPRSVLVPIVLVIGFLLVLEMFVVYSWRKYPKDTSFSYRIDAKGWELTLEGESSPVEWQDTFRFVVRRRVVMLYNETNRSNAIPKRCLSPEQITQMRLWFDGTRAEHRAREKEGDDRYRAEQQAKRMEAKDRRNQNRRRRK